LFYSGADNIMVSLWKVSDISTQLFMTDFYHNYLNPLHKNNYYSACRDAKLQLIHSGKFSNPYYWAPFILIGE
jgi:CHAT domain-containing protein